MTLALAPKKEIEDSIKQVHELLDAQRITSEKDPSDIELGDSVTYEVGDLSMEITYEGRGNSIAFLQSYDTELKNVLSNELKSSGTLNLRDKYVERSI